MKNSRPNNSQLDSTIQFVSGIRQLVRGREQEILEELQPLVESLPVRLDLSSIDRILMTNASEETLQAGPGMKVEMVVA